MKNDVVLKLFFNIFQSSPPIGRIRGKQEPFKVYLRNVDGK